MTYPSTRSVLTTPPSAGAASNSRNGTWRRVSSYAAARPLMPPPTMTTGAPDTRSGLEREEADKRFDGHQRRILREHPLRLPRERVNDVCGDLMNSLAIAFGEGPELFLQALELRPPDGVEPIVKGPARCGSAHDDDERKCDAATIPGVLRAQSASLPDIRQASITPASAGAPGSPGPRPPRPPAPGNRGTAFLPTPRRDP